MDEVESFKEGAWGFSGFFTFLEALGLGILLEDLSLLGGHFGTLTFSVSSS